MDDDSGTTFDAPSQAEGSRPATARIAIVAGQRSEVIELPPDCDISIGRSRSSAIVIEDGAASRLHATLRWDGDSAVALTEHGSRNGTFVDGRRVEGTLQLGSGAEIGIGSVRLLVSIPPSSAGEPSVAVDDADLTARDPSMLAALTLVSRAAERNVTVLLEGETGVGKDVLARRIHARSRRASGPFVAINCASVPETLAESALFGHERGAFTGAIGRQRGVFEAADGGTLFLDEVGELSAAVQARLLRVLEERAVVRIGSTQPVPVDVRVITATHRDLPEMVRLGAFREDLLYRLDVLRIVVPPLRSRPQDILPLAERFLRELGPTVRLGPDAIAALRQHRWPGNVRELKNVLERAVALVATNTIGVADLALASSAGRGGVLRNQVEDVERTAILEALEVCGGNQSRAARRLGISRRALIYKMERFGLKKPPASQS